MTCTAVAMIADLQADDLVLVAGQGHASDAVESASGGELIAYGKSLTNWNFKRPCAELHSHDSERKNLMERRAGQQGIEPSRGSHRQSEVKKWRYLINRLYKRLQSVRNAFSIFSLAKVDISDPAVFCEVFFLS